MELRFMDFDDSFDLDERRKIGLKRVGMWHPAYGFMEQAKYDRLSMRHDGTWDDVGFHPVYRRIPVPTGPTPGRIPGVKKDEPTDEPTRP